MGSKVAELFSSCSSIDDFRNEVLSCDGDFRFELEDMVSLGKSYVEKYPQCLDSTKYCQELAYTGYTMVRICIVEKILCGLDPQVKNTFRDMISHIDRIETLTAVLVAHHGREMVQGQYAAVNENLGALQAMIEQIPRGIIKERFSGGISSILNIMYLIRMALQKVPA